MNHIGLETLMNHIFSSKHESASNNSDIIKTQILSKHVSLTRQYYPLSVLQDPANAMSHHTHFKFSQTNFHNDTSWQMAYLELFTFIMKLALHYKIHQVHLMSN